MASGGQVVPERKTYALFSVQYPPHIGGIETFTSSLAHELAVRGHDVTVVTNDTTNHGAGISVENNVQVIRFPCRSLISGRLPLTCHNREFHELDTYLRSRVWDGMLINARFYPHSLYGMKLARTMGLTPVVLDHGSASLSFSNPLIDPPTRLFEKSITSYGKHRYHPDYYGISAKSVEWLKHFAINACGVIGNSIDAVSYRQCASTRDFRAELHAEQKFLVAFVGRFIPEKGISALIEASQNPDLRKRGVVFVLAGDGPLADDVDSAQSETLQCLGRLRSQDVSNLLQHADALCLPSRSEGFSTTLLEASACGCPSIVTDVGGAHELIPDKDHGTIIPSMSSDDICIALCALIDNPQLRMRQARACRELVETEYSWAHTAHRLERAFIRASKERI